MAVDASGGVALAYDTFRVDTSFDPGSRTNISQTVFNNITLFVKLGSAGNYVNEFYSFPDAGGLYDQASQIKSFETMPEWFFRCPDLELHVRRPLAGNCATDRQQRFVARLHDALWFRGSRTPSIARRQASTRSNSGSA
jgi:hypothetical protein